MMLFPINKARHLNNRYLILGQIVSKIFFSLKYDLQKAELDIDPERYSVAALISASLYAFMFMFVGLAFGVILTRQIGSGTLVTAFFFGFFAGTSALIFHMIYPKIAAMQIASMVDQELIFALRTMLIQLTSGMSLFESIKVISKSNYGQVSAEFDSVLKDMSAGMSETNALEKLAFRTKSDILKKSIWQIVTTMKSGGSVVGALDAQVEALVIQQADTIKAYAAELNLWTLVYLIVAAAMPSLGVTFLVIASTISSGSIGKEAVILIVLLSMTTQLVLIMLIRAKVPKVIK